MSFSNTRSIASQLLCGLIRFYQLSFAALFPGACRFEPSCSAYAREAIERHGSITGSMLALRRICRCHPWGGCGYDPVPNPIHPLICSSSDSR